MATKQPQLPSEILYCIVAKAVAQYVDDLILGPLSLVASAAATAPQLSNVVTSLLAVSFRFRHVTLDVLSTALAIPLNKQGVWGLREKPWKKVAAVREACAWRAGTDGKPLAALLTVRRETMPHVLMVYLTLHTIGTMDSLALGPGINAPTGPAGMQSVRAPTRDRASRLVALKAQLRSLCERCPAGFREVLGLRVDACLARSDMIALYELPFREVEASCREIASRLKQTAGAPVPGGAEVYVDLAWNTLNKVRRADVLVQRGWPHSTPVDAVIGAERYKSWAKLLDGMCNWPGHGERLVELRNVAKELRDAFSRRAARLVSQASLQGASC